jgi:hypothetical protein
MDIKERLAQTEVKMHDVETTLQYLEQNKQNLLQELLRLDGEKRLLMEMQKDELAR